MDPLQDKLRTVQRAFPDYAEALQLAYAYIHSDAGSSLTKSRMITEKLLVVLFKQEMGSEPRKPLLGELLADNQFTRKIDRRIVSRLNAIRDMGNLGPHGEKVESLDAARVLEDLCTILDWYQQRQGESPTRGAAAKRPRRWDLRNWFPAWRRVGPSVFGLAAVLLAYPLAIWWVQYQEENTRESKIFEARKAIEKQNLVYHEIVAHGDPEGFAGLFAEDGVVLSKGELVKGQQKIREWAQRSWQPGVGPFIQTVEIDVRGELAYEVGIFTRGKLSGSYLTVWKKQPDESWRIQAEVSSVKPVEKDVNR